VTSLTRVLPWVRPYRGRIAYGLLCVVLSTALYSWIPTLIRHALDAMAQGAPIRDILRIAATMLGVTLTMAVFRFQMRDILNGVSRVIEHDLREALFERLTHQDAAWYGRTRTGELMAKLTNDLGAVRMAVGPAIMYLTNTVFGGLFALSFMIAISPRLTLIAVAPMIVLPIITLRLGKAIHDRFERVQERFGALTTLVQEHLSGVRIIRAYRQEPAERSRFDAISEDYLQRNLALVKLQGLMGPSFALFAGLGAAAVLGFGGAQVVAGTITVGAFVAFGLYLANLTWPLIALGWVTSLFQRGAASMTRLLVILDAEPGVTDPAPPRATASLPPTAGGRALSVEHVHFAYPTADGTLGREVLTDVSVSVPAGATLGIVGATGSGKSTLLELIPRLADVTGGTIRLDGVDIRELPLEVLRKEIGFVPQESLLFSETLRLNLAYGAADAPAAEWAVGVAQLKETIDGFPGGFDTMLGERGINLSGGQKQRAALARALARRPSVVILDDALSAVDTHTEAAILRGLREALAGRTAIIASHRISAIRDANWILVLDAGRVVEQGRHEDLLALKGRYWMLLRRQQLEDELERDPVVVRVE
jgi:ATP-binding cassette, subfamily B, multidrug efflux pump